ncbi:hypothetical protein F511_46191 [Dorcoceras hygrometricum]|uniref:Uncharacterized protein n=1 Tax=Dorcoceras hygrometricum TaxID=472368 RepID=A0A2Z6ZU54_9LAMI|nr:hypothetical protein F511_46191 [Dorcoceras hygrometricum]
MVARRGGAPLRAGLADGCRSSRDGWPLEDDAWRRLIAAGRHFTRGRASLLRAASCAAAAIFVVVAPSPAAAPASLRRCRDGWSDFF